ncbi:hypothetical protein L227DRAFT_94201 [Lentinus tigrinus ALCF2SS1-6]|uniref:Uncharacterized protein n=1 Tax=Lentinus tigrinus ALCF2SS1-6 TaxID=1328759 RepID=A0A5C2SC21_9APHY|nr:hypothetical protein L227DRAFT_94201 [Lentinus tigrinus ALCF2SS1-6]
MYICTHPRVSYLVIILRHYDLSRPVHHSPSLPRCECRSPVISRLSPVRLPLVPLSLMLALAIYHDGMKVYVRRCYSVLEVYWIRGALLRETRSTSPEAARFQLTVTVARGQHESSISSLFPSHHLPVGRPPAFVHHPHIRPRHGRRSSLAPGCCAHCDCLLQHCHDIWPSRPRGLQHPPRLCRRSSRNHVPHRYCIASSSSGHIGSCSLSGRRLL